MLIDRTTGNSIPSILPSARSAIAEAADSHPQNATMKIPTMG
ncbi:hypothetical protein [Dictyobacter kobayashii]|nr:hypothetical protein [Dictyobacter kobayashii]